MENPYINQDSSNAQNNGTNGYIAGFDNALNGYLKNIPMMPENFNTAGFLRGLLIGAGVAYLLSNEKAQQSLFKAIVKAGNLLQSGTEELKERFEDAKAEVNAGK